MTPEQELFRSLIHPRAMRSECLPLLTAPIIPFAHSARALMHIASHTRTLGPPKCESLIRETRKVLRHRERPQPGEVVVSEPDRSITEPDTTVRARVNIAFGVERNAPTNIK
jgi:hypothetical protein